MGTFADLGISSGTLSSLEKLGFETPTQIQSEAIPHLMSGDTDMIGLAQTGTGKTAAFGLPLVELIDTKSKVTQALVIAPTRELCMQITKEMGHFSDHLKKLNTVAVYGGADIRRQITAIRKGAQLIVATPGRLKDLIKRKVVDLSEVQYVVLDEADEMLNMGFQEDIDEILETTPEEKNVWLFSATMPPEVSRIAKNYMRKPIEISSGDKNVANKNIDHQYLVVKRPDQYFVLRRLLDAEPKVFGLVFCRTRRDTKDLADKLTNEGYNADALHGDLNQGQRDRVMDKFRRKKLKILVATDVAARGIDVNDITHVYNFNIPDDLAFYTHRAGRTGRAGKKGVSIVLLSPREKSKLRRLERIIQAKFREIDLPNARDIISQQLTVYLDKWKDVEVHPKAGELIADLAEELKDFSKDDLIAKAVSLSFKKMLNSMDQQRERPAKSRDRDSRDRGRDRKSRERGGREFHSSSQNGLEQPQRMFINLGDMDFESKKELIKFIAEEGGIGKDDVHDLKLSKKNSFFTIEKKLVKKISSRFRDTEYEGRPLRVNPDGGPAEEGGKRKKKKKKWDMDRGKSWNKGKRKKVGKAKSYEGNFKKKRKKKKKK